MQELAEVPPSPAVAACGPVLHISYVKSGSYFLWKVLDGLFRAAGQKRSFVQDHPLQLERDRFPDFSIEQFDIDHMLIQDDGLFWAIEVQHIEPIRDLRRYLQQCSHVWSHSFLCDRGFEVYPQFARRCYIVRDPRDALLSMAHFVQTPFMRRYHPHPATSVEDYIDRELTRYLEDWCRHAGDHVRARELLDIEILRYEDMVQDLETHLRHIADWIGLPLDDAAVRKVADAVDMRKMKGNSPQHVRSGKSGGFRDVLTRVQQERALSIVRDTMRLCGYDT